MPRARRILYRKRHYDDGAISELNLWLVPQPPRGSAHAFRYRLFYGRPGELYVPYDNDRAKGMCRECGNRDHRVSIDN